MPRIGNIKLLLIEDNFADQEIFKETLEETSFPMQNLRVASRLDEGLKLIDDFKPDLLLLDLSLPDSHGLETIQKAIDKKPDLPIIVMTGLNDTDAGTEAISMGAEDYIVKGTYEKELLERALLYALQRSDSKRQMSKTVDVLRSYNQKLEQFAHIISHDLISPITTIKASIQLYELELKHNQLSKTPEEVMVDVHDGVNSLLAKLRSLMKTLVEQQDSEGQYKDIKLLSFVNSVINDVKHSYSNPEIDFELKLTDEQTLEFVPDLFYSIVQNLVTNAIKYRSPKRRGKIEISAESIDHYLQFKVADNGLGMDLEQNQNLLFKMFQRFHDHVEGRGIGLHLVKNIVYTNGGKIDVESELDKGTTFNIFLPRERPMA